MKNIELYLAFKFIRSKSNDPFIYVTQIFAFIGIALGVATLVIVISVMNGFRTELMHSITNFNGHITIKSYEQSIKHYQEIDSFINGLDGVLTTSCIINEQALIIIDGKYRGIMIMGIDYAKLKTRSNFEILLGHTSDSTIGIGSVMARNIGVKIGSNLKIISSATASSPFGQIPKSKTFKVGFIFSTGLHSYDSNIITMPISMAQKLFLYGDTISDIQVFLKDHNVIKNVLKQIKTYHLGQSLYTYDWQNSNKSLMNAVNVEKNVMTLILTLIVLVAMFNVISSMVMLVKDKKKDIAILRTIGFQKAAIMRIFIICGSTIGIIGTLSGLAFGVLFALNINNVKLFLERFSNVQLFSGEIYFLLSLPCEINVHELLTITLLSLLLSFLATIYPALKAGKQNPVDVLRYE